MNANGRRQVYVQGSALQVSWADATQSLTDLIFHGVKAALADAGVEMDDINSVVLGAHDLVDGRSLSSMVTAPAAGCYLRDEIRISGDGLNALALGVARIEAGETDLTVVAAWGRASEGDFTGTSRAMMDPFLEQPFGMDEFSISGMRLSRWLADFPGHDDDRRAAAEARAGRAEAGWRAKGRPSAEVEPAFPLRRSEAPHFADIVSAVILGEKETRFRLAGFGLSAEKASLGSRDLVAMPALREAAASALGEAGMSIDSVAVAEIDGLALSDEAISAEAMGLARPGQGFGEIARSNRINPSGGSAAGWCYPAMGLTRFISGLNALKEMNGRSHALATGASPMSGLTQTVSVLEAQ